MHQNSPFWEPKAKHFLGTPQTAPPSAPQSSRRRRLLAPTAPRPHCLQRIPTFIFSTTPLAVTLIVLKVLLNTNQPTSIECIWCTCLLCYVADAWISEIRHHRHWQHVLEHMCGSQLSALACKLPEHGTVMGGTMSLQGRNITLACFHGINFRSKSWALFTMDEPYICFATEAADVIDGQ